MPRNHPQNRHKKTIHGRKKWAKKWAWGLSGSGHFFAESLEIIADLDEVDIFASKAADELLKMYRQKIPANIRIFHDTTASAVPVGRFYQKLYHTLVMAPASSNTVAKCVAGISDTLLTNIFAQAGKCRVDCVFFPCDTAEELRSKAPKGEVAVYPRRIDLLNTAALREFERVEVVDSLKRLRTAVERRKTAVADV